MILKRFALGDLWTNCYLIYDDNNDGFIVDPGGPAAEVAAFIEKKGIKIHWIIITHGHNDHIGGMMDVRALSKNGVAIHEDDADCITEPSKNLSAYMGDELSFEAAEKKLREGDKLTAGKIQLEIIHTPGHTVGGICIVVSEDNEKILISGDTLFAGSTGRSDLPGGDENALINSLSKLEKLPTGTRVFPGHGPETTIGAEKMYNPYWPR